ncbi:MAG: efflux RND transporter permease subunit [Deltaproteobacteria bacterium]|nr:MAG: efflux RND transporter permease subunit [Deltaproteobacteria bacterium]TDJ05224.1 MAG: efflux RND transporter permease subunit [Deltaproteobacteria bacterium]
MPEGAQNHGSSWIDRLVLFFLKRRLVPILLLGAFLLWGVMVAPFDWEIPGLPRDPVPVDAIPDIGENQQIVFTDWPGRSPQDVEDQITYPLTVALLGLPGVKSVRSFSMFGFSSIYVIFDESVEFYWSRSRILEKLSSLPSQTLPEGVNPALGPDATPLGQVFWYTLEGRDPQGDPTGGWDLEELRSIQDWQVRYALQSVEGVSEVASVGGFVREYQIDADPDAMHAYGVSLAQVIRAVQRSNADVGARSIEVNRVEYAIRGVGFLRSVEDIEETAVALHNDVPVRIRDIAHVGIGPALRRGALDKGGAEAVGGVVVVRYGANPLEVIGRLKEKIAEISPALPEKVLADGTRSRVRIIPFYDRTGLIHETLGTLEEALRLEILVAVLVVLVLVRNVRSSGLIAATLPLAVLMAFIGMKLFSVDANIMALSGIAIAIGTMVDMGVIVCENIVRHLRESESSEDRLGVIYRATCEVGGAVVTAVATTVVSFLPVFTLQAAEGKLFRPLAFTKTFALLAAVVIALALIPTAAHLVFGRWKPSRSPRSWGELPFLARWLPARLRHIDAPIATVLAVLAVGALLVFEWSPLGAGTGVLRNVLFVLLLVGGLLWGVLVFQRTYPRLLRWSLDHKGAFLSIPTGILFVGLLIWLGFPRVFGWLPDVLEKSAPGRAIARSFPGLGREFMPPLDEGSFLYMPSTMAHASIGEALDVLSKLDMAIESIPEIDMVVGKLGRVESALDPAPISMMEIVVQYKPEYGTNDSGKRVRQWRSHIRNSDDIWNEILSAARLLGTTSAPKLQPIATRLVMLQTGMRAPMGLKLKGPDLSSLERAGVEVERVLKSIPSIKASTVIADRTVGKPYIELRIDRKAIGRYGLHVRDVQDVIEVAIGGRPLTTTVEGRERYPVRVRYPRELRDRLESLGEILVPTPSGPQVPLTQLVDIEYVRGPQVIKSEDTVLVSYVTFDMQPGQAEVNVVEDARRALESQLASGELNLPQGVSYSFAGTYENQIRSVERLRVVLPIALLIIVLILYFQFNSLPVTLMVFSGILVAWAGGFILLWLYAAPWFLDVGFFGANLRDVFQMHPINLSVAVWVGFIALFGIASDNGVLIATYLEQTFNEQRPDDVAQIRRSVVIAGERRIRPALITTATTVLALLPVLTSSGRGADIMIPMAVPIFGGMLFALVTLSVVPVLYCGLREFELRQRG